MSKSKISRNAPCPCGSGKKYKKCCIRRIGSTNSDLYIDDEGVHLIGEGTGPSPEKLKKMEAAYQKEIRNSPIWDEMVKQYGKKKAEELLKEFKVKSR